MRGYPPWCPAGHRCHGDAMEDQDSRFENQASGGLPNRWALRYRSRHKLRRIRDFPPGMRAPKRVRIYARGERFLVQWWDVASKKTLNVRIDGDLVDAIARAREIEARLENLGRSGHGDPKVGHEVLLDRYLDDLRRRADAGQIAVSTVERYEAAPRITGPLSASLRNARPSLTPPARTAISNCQLQRISSSWQWLPMAIRMPAVGRSAPRKSCWTRFGRCLLGRLTPPAGTCSQSIFETHSSNRTGADALR